MNREKYLSILRENLSTLAYEDRENAVAYYEEFFEDAGVENEQSVIANLGPAENLAKNILAESGIIVVAEVEKDTSNSYNNTKNSQTSSNNQKPQQNKSISSRNVLLIIVLILSFPIWSGVVLGVLGTIFGLVVAVFAIAVAFTFSSIALIVSGVFWVFTSPFSGVLAIGIGLFLLGLTIGLVYPLVNVTCKGIVYGIKGVGKFLKIVFQNNEVTC